MIKSREGTTQDDPLAMSIYAIATIPLIRKLNQEVTQIWYADDAASMGKISQMREWWNQLEMLGPSYGYYPNAAKTWLITKEEHVSCASSTFDGTGVQITTSGRSYLGIPIGTCEYIESFVRDRVSQWSSELEILTGFSKSQPHAAYSALTKGLLSNWSYVIRTTPNISNLLQPLKDLIKMKLIPALIDQPPPNDIERSLLSLPTRHGRMAITNPVETSDIYSASTKISNPLKQAIVMGECVIVFQISAKAEVQK